MTIKNYKEIKGRKRGRMEGSWEEREGEGEETKARPGLK